MMALRGLAVLWASATAARHGVVPDEYPSLSFPHHWGNGNIGVCNWLTRVAHAMNHTDIDAARAHVKGALDGLDDSTWAWLNVPRAVRSEIDASLAGDGRCTYNTTLAGNWPWRAWNDTCYDAVPVSPENHKILAQTDDLRVVNVYGPPETIEEFHTHQRLSFFLHWGLDHCGSLFYDENYDVLNDEPNQSGNATDPATGEPYPMVLNLLWMDAQWLHAVYYKNWDGDLRCAQCPKDDAPANCGPGKRGFFLRFELEIFPRGAPPPTAIHLDAKNPAVEYCQKR